MILKRSHIVLGLGALLFVFFSCSDKPTPTVKHNPFEFPSHFPDPYYNNPENLITDAGLAFGKALFYDPVLSRDSTISCGSCHAQSVAFADDHKALSTGIDGRIGTRNSPSLFNLAWNTSFMWDGGINHIEVMPLGPIENVDEMDENMLNILSKLNTNAQYLLLNQVAFQRETITSKEVLYALAQFMSSMISSDAKYDRFIQGKENLTEDEFHGYLLYQRLCASCHTEPLFTNYDFINNGLDSSFIDPGRMRITLLPSDEGKFKVPSLRNIAVSAPYMHDGRFTSLEDVLNHYSGGITASHSLDASLSNYRLRADQKHDIISFLTTLTDEAFLTNPLFSQP